ILSYNYPIIDYFMYEMERYDDFRVNVGSPILQKLFALPFYLRIPLKFIFLLLNPSPSLANLYQFFIVLGTILQFLFTPFTALGIISLSKRKDIISITFILMFLMIVLVSVDSKHKVSLIMLGVIPTYYGLLKLK